MTERAYTVKEIDKLRDATSTTTWWGRYKVKCDFYISFGLEERSLREKVIEEKVRTYMLAGITAKDIWIEYDYPESYYK